MQDNAMVHRVNSMNALVEVFVEWAVSQDYDPSYQPI
jgi:hypothetical protein